MSYSNPRTGLTAPFQWDLARGVVYKHEFILKFGRNPDVDTGAYEDIWDGGGTWVAPTQARVHALVSDAAADTAAGTGARTVMVLGLDSDFRSQSETVTLNGLTPVNTANSYNMIHSMYVVTAGSGGTDAGNITATAATDNTVTAQITAGFAQTLMAIYQIPAGHYGLIVQYYAGLNNATAATSGDVKLLVKGFGEVFQTKHLVGVLSAGSSTFRYDYDIPLLVDEKSIIKLAAECSANNCNFTGGFDIVLVEK